ncbi:MAG: xanthan lyase [Pirellulaceae bacterium]|nr:MAG: xanthan lyase [Pirellulaceae bacterium]
MAGSSSVIRFFCGIFLLGVAVVPAAAQHDYDIVIYGATPAGITAAIQARREGKSCVLLEPERHVGGMTSGGLGATDIGNKGAIGGLARQFYRRIKQHYQQPQAWKYERPEQYRSGRQSPQDDAMWTFEPHVAEQIFRQMLEEAAVPVLFEHRLDREGGVEKRDGQIVCIRMTNGHSFRGKVFIDATYEGDLMAAAGVSFHVGREANSVYSETLNGVQTRLAIHHQLMPGVDPYRRKGDPSSGLLPGIHADPPGEDGSGDHRVQAYNLRLCLTDVAENQIPIEKPADYDEERYELLLRNFEAGETRVPWSLIPMPNRKTDINNNHGVSTDYIGMNYDWPSASYERRRQLYQEHLSYIHGLLWTLAHHPRVPENVRREVSRWGLCKDEFTDNGGWPHQLYVREARRMVSDFVMTQHHCQGRAVAEDSVGLAAYTMDSHNVQRYVDQNGFVRNEGDVQVGGFPPYPISYRAIRPRAEECRNLLVPVALSASHIAYGSIRMEPVFMVLGQSAGVAACLAIERNCDVQQVPYELLRERLVAENQILQWTGPRPPLGRSPGELPGIVVDDLQAEKEGTWLNSSSVGGFVGIGYLHDNNQSKGRCALRFRTELKPGRYQVRFWYTPHANRATQVPVVVVHAEGRTERRVNQRTLPENQNYVSLGEFAFGDAAEVWVFNRDTDGYVVADAVQFVPR